MRTGVALTLLLSAVCLVQIAVPLADEPDTPKARPLGFAPIDYFDKRCSRCHGPGGAFYGDHFGKELTPDELAPVVKEMTEGPGKSPLSGDRLESLIAFHRSLIVNRPFIVWTETTEKGLKGEVTAGATLRVSSPVGEYEARVEGVTWTLDQPDLDPDKLKLTAEIAKRKTTLLLSESPYSHFRAK